MRWVVLWALGLILTIGSFAAAAETRLALVVGQNDYRTLSKLNNPVPDATAVAAALRTHGFEVTELHDLPRAEFLDALEAFRVQSESASVALVYYAGHGLEVLGKNVLAPVDMEIDCDRKVPRRAIDLEELFNAVSGSPQQIVLLDACRNDPFPQCPARSIGSGGGFRGFSRMGTEGRSLLIANATLSGQLAADGDAGQHSPFAKALLARFQTETHRYFRDLLDLTASDVARETRGTQNPEILTRAGAPRFCLDPLCGAKEVSTEEKPAASGGPLPDAAQQAWEAIARAGADDLEVFEAFLRQHPEGVYAALAKSRIARLKQGAGAGSSPETPRPSPEAKIAVAPPIAPAPAPAVQAEPLDAAGHERALWEAAKQSGDANKVWDYVLHHPESPHIEEARAEYARLTGGTPSSPQIADTPPAASPAPLTAAPMPTDAKAYDLALWNAAKNSGDPNKVWDYVLHHPDSPHVEEARAEHARLTGTSPAQLTDTAPAATAPQATSPSTEAASYELKLWNAAKDSGSPAKIWDYVLHHPDSPYVEEARAEHERVKGRPEPDSYRSLDTAALPEPEPIATPQEDWGAAAISLSKTLVTAGTSLNRGSEAEAKEAALAACRSEGGRNCKVVTTWSNGGCGYATTGKNRRGQLGWGVGPNSADALKNCTKQGLRCSTPIGGCTLSR